MAPSSSSERVEPDAPETTESKESKPDAPSENPAAPEAQEKEKGEKEEEEAGPETTANASHRTPDLSLDTGNKKEAESDNATRHVGDLRREASEQSGGLSSPVVHLGDVAGRSSMGERTGPSTKAVRFFGPSSRRSTSRQDAGESPAPASPAVRFSMDRRRSHDARRSMDYKRREEAGVYYDSRASTRNEFKRRASTLSEYYARNPNLLPQLPYTLRHGWRRWKVIGMGIIMVIDACLVPIILYYVLTFGANIAEWIIFAIVATIWGGPTYMEFASRTLKLIKKENFYRPLGQNSRVAFDITEYVFTVVITATTVFLAAGSAPHHPWIRILSLPAPSILLSFGTCMFVQTMWSMSGRPAPFRISSTPKGGKVPPGVYTLVEDIVAVNGSAGRPFREAIEARYLASVRFRELMRDLSLFWSVPALVLGTVLFIVICVHSVPKAVGYGLGWGVPFVWAGIWVAITIPWVRKAFMKEHAEWDEKHAIGSSDGSGVEMV